MAASEDALGRALAALALERGCTAAAVAAPPCVVVFQALPLAGKSTLCRGLCALLLRTGCVPRWLNQDEVAVAGSKRRAFLAALAAALAEPGVTHILVDKTNIDELNMDDLAPLCTPAALVRLRHPRDAPCAVREQLALARARFALRGDGHRSLRPPAAGAATALAAGAGVGASAGVAPGAAAAAASAAAVSAAAAAARRRDGDANIDSVLSFFANLPRAGAVCGGLRSGEAFGVIDGAGVVSLSVVDPPALALATLWSALAARRLVPAAAFHPADAHMEAFALAVSGARAYERHLGAFPVPPPVTRFFGVALGDEARRTLVARVPAAARVGAADGLVPLADDLHLTLAYTGGCVDHLAELRWAPRLAAGDTAVQLECTGIAWDARVCAALVPAGLGGADRGGLRNAHGHITLALAPGAATVEANALLRRRFDDGDTASVTVELFAEPLRLDGVLRRFPPRAPAPAVAAAAHAAAHSGGGSGRGGTSAGAGGGGRATM